jgi:alpha/beta superfamily hydrolase
MRNPVVAAIARACAERGWYALRFNFRGVGASEGTWSGGAEEWRDVGDAVDHARELAPGKPLGVSGYSFGALMTLKWLASGGRADGVALVGVGLRSVNLTPQDLPPIPDGTFIVGAENDQFGTASELRAAFPRARVAEVTGVDHFFVGKHDEVGRLVGDELAQTLG